MRSTTSCGPSIHGWNLTQVQQARGAARPQKEKLPQVPTASGVRVSRSSAKLRLRSPCSAAAWRPTSPRSEVRGGGRGCPPDGHALRVDDGDGRLTPRHAVRLDRKGARFRMQGHARSFGTVGSRAWPPLPFGAIRTRQWTSRRPLSEQVISLKEISRRSGRVSPWRADGTVPLPASPNVQPISHWKNRDITGVCAYQWTPK